MIETLRTTLHDLMEADSSIIVMGEDVGQLGGVFRVTDGLLEKFGRDRVIDSPLAEAGLVGTAIGLALNGFRPVVEIQFDGFVYPALNQLLAHASSYTSRVLSLNALPLTLRLPVGGRIRSGELHGENPETHFVHRPNLRVVAASDARTAGDLLRAAVKSDDPVIFLEPKRQYRRRVQKEGAIPVLLDRARVLRPGAAVVAFSYGSAMDLVVDAAARLGDEGTDVRVVDLVSLAPLDIEAIVGHANEVGRVVAVTEAVARCSVASEVISVVSQECFGKLASAPVLVAAPNTPYPMSDHEAGWYPSVDKVVAAIREALK